MQNPLRNVVDKIGRVFQRTPKIITVQMELGSGNMSTSYLPGYGSGPKMPGGLSAHRLIDIHSHFVLRQQVRDMMYDSKECRAMVETMTDATVDVGLRLKPTPESDILGLTLEEAEKWSDDVANRFHLWAKSKTSARNRLNNFYQNQRLYQFFQQRDNDVFVRYYYGRDKDASNPLQIEFIDPNQIKGFAYTSTYAQLNVDDGIVRDANGREIGYKVWNFDGLSGESKEQYIPARGEKSGRLFMIHGFTQEYAGQGRGMPGLSHAIQEFEKITDFDISTIQKAITQASLVMAVENEQKDPSNPLAQRVAEPVRNYGQYAQPDPNGQNTQNFASDSTMPIINYQVMPEATITSPGSTGVFNLRRGDKLNYLRDTSPSQEYGRFREAFIAALAASKRIPVEILLQKFSSNYSASRAAFVTFYRVAQYWRNEMASDFLDPTYEQWLSEEIAAGRITAPGWNDPLLRMAWLSCEWAGIPMPNIDPEKTAAADLAYVRMGAQTLDDVARNFNGSSGKANRAKNARQYQELPPYPFDDKGALTEPKPAEETEQTVESEDDDV